MTQLSGITVDRQEQLSSGQQSAYLLKLCDGQRSILVNVQRKRRKTLCLQVGRAGAELRVPTNCSWNNINAFLRDHFDWILVSLEDMSRQPEVVRDIYEPGGEISFLGVRYRLNVVKSRISVVTLDSSDLYVSCSNPANTQSLERQVLGWFRRQAEEVFAERLKVLNRAFMDDLAPTGLTVRKMRSRWGSCSSSGEVCLNLMLVREHLSQIDFVVAHELCHLRHFSHNDAFYELLDKVMPDWRQRERELTG